MQNLDVAPTQESYDDGESEWNSNNSIDLFDLASAAGRLAGNLNNKPGALDDFFNKLKGLEHEWYEAEKRFNKLRMENDVLNNQLMHERTKCAVYQKKLRFIQDNQKNFEKLKEVYLAMKQQECKSSTLDVCEQACQTVDYGTGQFESKAVATMSTFSCDKECLTKYHGNVLQSDSMIAIRRSELTDAHENLQLLKDMIKTREFTWSVNVQREESMKEQIRLLEEEKRSLDTVVRMKDVELKAMKNMKSQNPIEQQDNVNNMKRIIGKLSQRLRDLEKLERSGRLQRILDDREEEVVKEIECGDFVPQRPQVLKTQMGRTGA
ncbi:hypothetical protein AMK59_7963, partial [Oryctes borbonicus]